MRSKPTQILPVFAEHKRGTRRGRAGASGTTPGPVPGVVEGFPPFPVTPPSVASATATSPFALRENGEEPVEPFDVTALPRRTPSFPVSVESPKTEPTHNPKETTPTMASYKEPSFQERTALAQQARDKALKRLAAKPAADPAAEAQRAATRLAREAAAAEKSAARKAALQQAKADKQAAAKIIAPPAPTEAELKAARDERYAARKKRKG